MANDEKILLPEVRDENEDRNREKLIYFDDGSRRRIDFVLAYEEDEDLSAEKRDKVQLYRNKYLQNLQDAGLELEMTEILKTKTGYGSIERVGSEEPSIHFIKVHAPMDVLYDSAEDMKMKMKTKRSDIDFTEWYETNAVFGFMDKLNPLKLHSPETDKMAECFVQPFNKDRLSEFINYDKPDLFFTAADRGRLVAYILERTQYDDDPVDVGIEHLIYKKIFNDAYPLHDGPIKRSYGTRTSNRQKLQTDWANWCSVFKYQPIDAIKDYFGEKIGLYFAWLGFYTAFLVPAAFAGVICFIYGLVNSVDSPLVKETCSDVQLNNGTEHLFYMCPLCDKQCSYFLLSINCAYARVTNVFDNEAMPFFAAFMSLWSTFFLEFWKRQQVRLACHWHCMGFEEAEEQVRPEYIVCDTVLKRNPVTGLLEPYMPKRTKIPRLLGTFSVVTFFIVLILICVFGIIAFRAIFSVTLVASDNLLVRQSSKTIVSVTAGVINVVVIYILKYFYKKVAVVLTEWENPRTRTDYDNSFTLKMFWFQFFNTFSSIIYIAFLKSNNLVGSPGRYRRIGSSNARLEGCSAQGCFFELSIQLVIVMAGNIVWNIIEFIVPTLKKWWCNRKSSAIFGQDDEKQWADDYKGEIQTKFSMFWPYSEMVLQYGFLTMFVAAFPLAPLIALLSNLFEIRVDAYNYIHNFRRPVARRAECIGAWYNILATITSVSVLVNGLVIAFTSEFIPRMVYRYSVSDDQSLSGFVDWSLSSFDVNDFSNTSRSVDPGPLPLQHQCRYPGYYETAYPYNKRIDHWIIMTARLAFVLVFVVTMIFVEWAIAYFIPDVPRSVQIKIKREKYLEQKADIDHKESLGKRRVNKARQRLLQKQCEVNGAVTA